MAQGASDLNVTAMEIPTCGGEIIGILKKLKDTWLADSQKAVTIETNLRQGDLGLGVDTLSEFEKSVAPSEIWLREDLEKVNARLF